MAAMMLKYVVVLIVAVYVPVAWSCPYFQSAEWQEYAKRLQYERATPECKKWTENQFVPENGPYPSIIGNMVASPETNKISKVAMEEWKHGVTWCCVQVCRDAYLNAIPRLEPATAKILQMSVDAQGTPYAPDSGQTAEGSRLACQCNYKRAEEVRGPNLIVNGFIGIKQCVAGYEDFCASGLGPLESGPITYGMDGNWYMPNGTLYSSNAGKCEPVAITEAQLRGNLPVAVHHFVTLEEILDGRILVFKLGQKAKIRQIIVTVDQVPDYKLLYMGLAEDNGDQLGPGEVYMQETSSFTTTVRFYDTTVNEFRMDDYEGIRKIELLACDFGI